MSPERVEAQGEQQQQQQQEKDTADAAF
jgi:hypothetical protein